MKLVVRFREVKIQSKRHILRGWGRPQTHGGGLTGRLSKARDQRDSNLAPFSALTITNFSKEKCFFFFLFHNFKRKGFGKWDQEGIFCRYLRIRKNLTKYSWIQLVKHWKLFFSVIIYVRDYIFVIFIIGKDTG
jgi:hypothetical protein